MNDRLEEIKRLATEAPYRSDPNVAWLIAEVEALRVRATEAEAALRKVAAQAPLYDELASAATEYRVAWQWNGPETQAAARERLFAAAKALPLAPLAAAVPDEVTE